ncbi:FlgO family outer membrane protein [Motiliproteus coralliicola]|nr:FlgO family outer membrane protein [Motiliproteus coralliicola]
MKQLAVTLFTLSLVAGCADRPIHVVVDNEVATRVTNPEALQPTPTDPAERSAIAEPVSYLGGAVRQMAEQIETSLAQRGIKRLPIAITPFVELSAATEKRPLGDELAEGFYHELQARGFNLIDHRALPFADRSLENLPLAEYYRRHRISYVLGGTYNVNSSGVTVNARMLDTVTQQVVATGQSDFGIEQLEGAFPGYDPFSSQDGMIIENGGVPVQ